MGGLPRADGGTGSTTRRDDTRTRPGPTAPAPSGRHDPHPTGDPPARWGPACLLRLRPRWPFSPPAPPARCAQPTRPANAPSAQPTRPANAHALRQLRPPNAPTERAQPTRPPDFAQAAHAPSQRAQPTPQTTERAPANAPAQRRCRGQLTPPQFRSNAAVPPCGAVRLTAI